MINLNIDNDMPTLLSDFNFKELMFLYLAVQDKIEDFQRSITIANDFQDGPIKEDLLKSYNERLEIATLWRAKIYEAELEVKRKDIIQSN